MSRLAVIVPIVCLAALAAAATQSGANGGARSPAWRVVVSNPVVVPGHKVGDAYQEHEYLTAMFERLDRDGLVPVFTQVLSQPGVRGTAADDRILVFCQKR